MENVQLLQRAGGENGGKASETRTLLDKCVEKGAAVRCNVTRRTLVEPNQTKRTQEETQEDSRAVVSITNPVPGE